MSTIRVRLCSSILVVLLLFGCLCSLVPIKNADSQVATSTYYDYKALFLGMVRDKIVSSYISQVTSCGIAGFIMTATNETPTTQNYGYEYGFTKTGSLSLGAGVKVKAIELELGFSGSYSEYEVFSASVTVPGNRAYSVWLQSKTVKSKYSSTIQSQALGADFKWRNQGLPYTSASYFTAVGPNIIIRTY